MYKYKPGDKIFPRYWSTGRRSLLYYGIIKKHDPKTGRLLIRWAGTRRGEWIMQWFIDEYYLVHPVQKVL